MKRPVSLLASFTAGLALLGACAAEAAGKDEFAGICAKRMGSVEKCGCYVDSIEKTLTPEQFARLAKGAHQNREYSGADWLPNTLRAEPAINDALNEATQVCFT